MEFIGSQRLIQDLAAIDPSVERAINVLRGDA